MRKAGCKVSIIIPNYNRKKDLERLLPSIANQTFGDYEVIIIDDFSSERSVIEYIKNLIKDYDNMYLVENMENIGFVRTCNKGIKLSSGDYICILTNDTEVTKDFVKRNVQVLDSDSSIGVLSCVIVDQNGNNWFTGGSLERWIPKILKDDFQGVRAVDFVAGTACFYRREVFDKIGLLDEYLVMYHEDVEFCLRVRHETDYKVCIFAENLVTHHIGTSELAHGKFHYFLHRNIILIWKKYAPGAIPKVLFYFLAEIMNLFFISIIKLNAAYFLCSPYIVWGVFDGLKARQTGKHKQSGRT